MVHSRELAPSARAVAQEHFTKFVDSLNTRFRGSIAARFVITVGDEFQGLLRDSGIIPDLVWSVENEYTERQIRLGIGYGVLHTPLRKVAINVDGPALHRARAAISEARDNRWLGGVFKGYGAYDDVLTGIAQILRYVRQEMTSRQKEVIRILRDGGTQQTAAAALGISKQAVSEHVLASGWEAYKVAETAWKSALRLATNANHEAVDENA